MYFLSSFHCLVRGSWNNPNLLYSYDSIPLSPRQGLRNLFPFFRNRNRTREEMNNLRKSVLKFQTEMNNKISKLEQSLTEINDKLNERMNHLMQDLEEIQTSSLNSQVLLNSKMIQKLMEDNETKTGIFLHFFF